MQRSLMRTFFFLAFFCCISFSITAQVAITEKGDVHMRLVYGEGVTRIKGRDIVITDYLKAKLSTSQLGPYKNIQIATRWWILMGQLVYNTGIVWNYNNSFSFYHPRTQQNYTIDKQKLSRYPSLLTMLENARPLKWNMRINVNCAFETAAWKGNIQTEFKLSDNDVIIFPEGKEPLMVSGSPRSFSDRIRFINKDTRGTVGSDLNYWYAVQAVTSLNTIEGLNFENPVEEWYRIVQLYDQYVEEGKALEEEYALLSDDHVPAAVDNARNQSGWSTPFEEPHQEGKVVWDKQTGRYNIEAGGRKMLPVENSYARITALALTSHYFIAVEKGVSGPATCIINAKGKKMTIAGVSMFDDIIVKDGQLQLILKNKNVDYKSRFKYGGDFGQDYESPRGLTYFTEAEFSRFKSQDYERPKKVRSSGNGVVIGRGGYIMEFKKGKIIKAGPNLQALSQTDVYFAY